MIATQMPTAAPTGPSTTKTSATTGASLTGELGPLPLETIDLSAYDPEQSKLMDERCIVVTPADVPIGALDKKTCHLMSNIRQGLLHRAFSVFLFRPTDGALLLQKRASEKITFPDMWTNTCCSHPLDDFEEEKEMRDAMGVKRAATRKLEHELGIPQSQTPVEGFQYLTRIHYLAPSDGIWGEHEIDYILFMSARVDVNPNLNEISEYKYVSPQELKDMMDVPGSKFTPWFRLIVREFLFPWWDALLQRSNLASGGKIDVTSMKDLAREGEVVKVE
ncbi:isopentenyl-diphosphate delta-isomerase [Dacryopinax primogenitus]|uniref:isopentenyl-diphosphate Delta-isomerase n=1 Tax=Dacryopinax primogenitus (strain DJM 731) TaxID=1858805 RepID=M5G266_DACPD|nr:isopentenyl-diphosphate delta-isomerase [Dacryopinax primogenitus]EJT97857.1 isopentenyl-diphosphate delta-isomerase [Dacryopinax primogenitus]